MAEVQKNPISSGEMTQRFIEFVMMQAQQAAMFLGRGPQAEAHHTEVNLQYARLFIDQLEMIREKTRGNLSDEETKILSGVLADLQLAFVETSGGQTGSAPAPVVTPEAMTVNSHAAQTSATPEVAQGSTPQAPSEEERESKKRFTKSYG